MTGQPRLRPEDRADFEWVLDLALDVTDIRTTVTRPQARNQAPHALEASRLRAQVLADADLIAAAAAAEYGAYVRARAAVEPSSGTGTGIGTASATASSRTGAGAGAGALLPLLGVLAPVISAIAATVFLVLGYGIQFATPESQVAATLITAGWVSGLMAAITTCIGLGALLVTALRVRTGPPAAPCLPVHNPEAEQARATWHQALLERGLLPYLREQLTASPPYAD
ncbi:hypothetical protein [Streptomyces sp. NPDC059063]|uniref:hypothetical protein n=1 Tax=unclassified Streptomyces TaxID=2593676 RepID=UPI003685BB5B